MKVLLIDDDKINNFLNRSIIEKHCGNECVVSEFINPEEAFYFLKSCALGDGTDTPDIIFLDINMPEMSGFELLEKMKSEGVCLSPTKIYILSSSLDPNDIEKSRGYDSVTDFISKPLDKIKIEQIKNSLG